MSNADFVEKNYDRIATDPDYRAKLIADPVGVVCAEFGYTPGPDFKIEIIEQVEDTIVIMVPPKPERGRGHGAGAHPGDGTGLRPALFVRHRRLLHSGRQAEMGRAGDAAGSAGSRRASTSRNCRTPRATT